MTKTDIRNRIKEVRRVRFGDVQAHPHNFRRHPKNQRDALTGVVSEVGFASVPLAYHSPRNGGALTWLDGHLRSEAFPDYEGDVGVLDVDDAEAALLLATLDPLAALATHDAAALDELLRDVQTGDAAVQAMLADVAKEAGLYADKAAEDTEPQVDRAEELRVKWGVQAGQLWRLGDHRLICGDCTDAATVARVMGGERAALAPVDPPYNVGFDYDGRTVDDTKDAAAYERFSRAWFGVCQSVSERQIVTPGCNNLALWMRWFDAYHWAPWIKTNSMTNGRTSRFWCWEPVLFYGSGFGKSRTNDVFDYPIGQQKEVANHPCPKPLKMWLDLVENYSKPGDVVFESFSGSGTTLIACENLGRKCRAVEISPAYVAVALERWAQHTGRVPELVG